MNRIANSCLIVAIIFALASICRAGWTGVIMYVDDPRAAWNETSSCPPCNQACGDLSRFVPGTSWRIGYTQYKPNGESNHIVIMKALPGEATPYFESILDGRSVRVVEGYRGNVEEITNLYPGPKVTRVQIQRPASYQQFHNLSTYTTVSGNQFYQQAPPVYRGICVNGVCY